ncbi:MAG: HAD-IIB family hydrolase, partial [Deltaproteobacteria bacterium]|nr:HAD-IIB family hydrolase [Deltaproteobacteria bacterium]
MKPVIFTDLDGTLLHPKDYSTTGAEDALRRVRAEKIPLVFSSSKSRAEMEALRKKLSNSHPFISENGGGVFIPKGYFPFPSGGLESDGYKTITLGVPYARVRGALIEARAMVNGEAKGFGDMTPEEVSALTGLGLEDARLARARDFDEPFVFTGSPGELERLFRLIGEKGFTWTRGRFCHILGPHDKGKAVSILKGLYGRLYGRITTIGLGNHENDLPLLREADYPVLVMNEDGSYAEGGITGL